MNTAIDLISNQKNKNQSKIDTITLLQKQIKNSNSYLDKTLISHFIKTNEYFDIDALESQIGYHRVTKIILSLLEKKSFNQDIILNKKFLTIIERIDKNDLPKVEKNLQKSFDSFDLKSKLKFAFFCDGYINLYDKFPFIKTFILNEFDIKDYSPDESSILSISGYNYENSCAVLKVTMKKDDLDGAEKIAKSIFDILSTGSYINDKIGVFEYTLSQYYNIFISIGHKDGLIIPSVCKGRYNKFESKKENLLEQLTECVEYVAKNHPYYGIK